MNEQEKKEFLKKLNEDNKNLTDAHKSWVEFSKGSMIIGFLFIIVILVLYLCH